MHVFRRLDRTRHGGMDTRMRVRIALLLSALLVSGEADAQVVSSFLAPLTVARGGIGVNTCTAYSPVFAGTTATGAFQCAVGVGTSGQVLTSNGAGVLPSWQVSASFSSAGSGSEIQARLTATTVQAVTGSSTANGGIALVNQSAAAVPFSVTGAASQSGNLLDVTANGGGAGGLFAITSAGRVGIGIAAPAIELAVVAGAASSRVQVQNTSTGTTSTDGLQFAVDTSSMGYVWLFENQPLNFATNNTQRMAIAADGALQLGSGTDTGLSRISAGVVGVGTGAASSTAGEIQVTTARVIGANGGSWARGSTSELLTLSTSGTTTDTAADLLPANCTIEAVAARITTTIATATNWSVGDPTTAARFSSANSTLTAGTTSVGLNHQQGSVTTDATGPVQTTAAKVRITTTGTPSAGAIRLTSYWSCFVAPTS